VASAISPLGYQWQKNQVNLSNGGHYSGCTLATLTIANADSSDAAGYRCLVTNAYGSIASSPATLAVITNAFGSVTALPCWRDTNNEASALPGPIRGGLSERIMGSWKLVSSSWTG
jgi:hypothetical protein